MSRKEILFTVWITCVALLVLRNVGLPIPAIAIDSPFPSDGGYMLIVVDSESTDPADSVSNVVTKKVREICDANNIDLRVRDKDTKLAEPWSTARDSVEEDYSLPAAIGRKGSKAYKGEAPTSEKSLIATIEDMAGI